MDWFGLPEVLGAHGRLALGKPVGHALLILLLAAVAFTLFRAFLVRRHRDAGRAMRSDTAWSGRMLDELEPAGVESWADAWVVVRCRFKVLPLEQWNVKREFLRRLKRSFDAQDIEIPHLTVFPGTDKLGKAAALRAVDARLEGEARAAEPVRAGGLR